MSRLTYYNPQKFNGVLILLREPHDEGKHDNAQGALEGNKCWFENKIIPENPDLSQDEKTGKMLRLFRRYRNRFKEMLSYCGENTLENVAFANIKSEGGGSSASVDYWSLTTEKKKENFKKIKEEIEKSNVLSFVFTVDDIFDAIIPEFERNGLIYNGKKYEGKSFRKAEIDGITYCEILHPSRSPRIILENKF